MRLWNILVYKTRENGEPDLLKICCNRYYEVSKKAMIDRGCRIISEFKGIPYKRLGDFEKGVRNAMRKQREEIESELASAVA